MDQPNRIDYVGYVQIPVIRGEVSRNLNSLQRSIQQLQPPPRTLLVLPELWGTGFAYQDLQDVLCEIQYLYEELRVLARGYNILLAGSLPESIPEKEEQFYNTLTIIGAEGSYGSYRKQHLFPGEESTFCPAPFSSMPITTPFGSFGCMVCYDIRFPNIARNQCQQGADILLCAAEWPTRRISHLRSLAIARAIENQTYMVVCNAIGWNGEIELGGQSLIISPDGKILCDGGVKADAQLTAVLWPEKAEAQRQFKSFTEAPFLDSWRMKIGTAITCLSNIEQRYRSGQRIIFIRIGLNEPLFQTIERLEQARRLGDYLVVAADIGVVSLPGKKYSERQTLATYAALGCVGSIFPMEEEMEATFERRFRRCSYIFQP
jgi:D-glycero-beta-D-manno-heptose 1-phosphate adenylyltransferase